MFYGQYTGFGGGGEDPVNLYEAIVTAGLSSNIICCLDAGASDSYSGSGQTWADLSSNNFDWFLGSSGSSATDDPTFNGEAGALTSSEYFSGDGGDYFRYNTTNESVMEDSKKDNAAHTMIWVLYLPDLDYAANAIFGSRAGAGANNGWEFELDGGDNTFQVVMTDTNGGGPADEWAGGRDGDTAISHSAWHFLAMSHVDPDAGSSSFFYMDGGYNQVSSANTWSGAWGSAVSNNSSYTYELMAAGNAYGAVQTGWRLACFAWFDQKLTFAEIDTLYSSIGPRFGLS